jgi:hypothetical protein
VLLGILLYLRRAGRRSGDVAALLFVYLVAR